MTTTIPARRSARRHARRHARRLALAAGLAGILLSATSGCRSIQDERLDPDLSVLRDRPAGGAGYDAAVLAAAESITAAAIQRGVDELASDRMNGRHWKSPEGWLAAGWVAGRMSAIGLEPAAPDGTWYDELAEHPGSSPNVMGRIPGTGDGIVLLTAHYDHLRTRTDVEPGADAIYNGADDNASGVMGILEAARALKQVADRTPLPATILVIAFSGEEAGLRGARDIAADPPFALDRVIGMINCDMISRNEPNALCVEGVGAAPRLAAAIDRANRIVGLDLTRDENLDWLRRSDQGPFLAKGVPAILLSVPDHPDYHQVTDHADRIDAELAMKATRLLMLAAHDLATGATPAGDG